MANYSIKLIVDHNSALYKKWTKFYSNNNGKLEGCKLTEPNNLHFTVLYLQNVSLSRNAQSEITNGLKKIIIKYYKCFLSTNYTVKVKQGYIMKNYITLSLLENENLKKFQKETYDLVFKIFKNNNYDTSSIKTVDPHISLINDNNAEEIYDKLKKEIQKTLGTTIEIFFYGWNFGGKGFGDTVVLSKN